MVEAIRATVESLGSAAAGLVAWVAAADRRAEVGQPGTGPLVEALVRISGRLIATPVALPDPMPVDHGPSMHTADLAIDVAARLRQLSVDAGDTVVSRTGIVWDLPGGQCLSLSGGFGGWAILRPTDEPGVWREVLGAGLPSATYAHPGLIAERVAAFLNGRGVAPCGANHHPDTV